MTTSISNLFTINGVIDTSKNVLDNINTMASAAASWVTFDIQTGKWSVVVNEPGSAVTTFTDSNIIGGINISGTGVTELYDKVQVEFPHKDLNDQIDTITYEIDPAEKFPYELGNTLNFKFDCINNPVQAEYLAILELKQSRVDKVISFRTDFSSLGLKAGDIISITNSMYGYSNKLFRVLSIAEEDDDAGNILLSITAFEYDENIYNSTGLVRTERTTANDIANQCNNNAIANSEQAANETSILKLLVPLAASAAINGLWNLMFPKVGKKMAEAMTAANATVSVSATNVCEGNSVIATFQACCQTCQDLTDAEIYYEITGVSAQDIGVPLTGTLLCNSSGVATLTIPILTDSDSGVEAMTIKSGKSSQVVNLHDQKSYQIVLGSSTITEGGSTSVTFNTTGIPNGTVKNYTISGSGTGQLSGTPTSGQVTINNNTASITVVTKDIDSIVDTQLTIEFDSGTFYCSGNPATITILKTGTPPPPDTNCEWVTIPQDWCATFDGTTGNPKSVFPTSTIIVLKAISGQPKATVPLTASVDSSGVITITSTAEIDMASGKGGRMAKIIQTFNNMTPGVKRVTGTTIDVVGR